jgi:hypothetical protein
MEYILNRTPITRIIDIWCVKSQGRKISACAISGSHSTVRISAKAWTGFIGAKLPSAYPTSYWHADKKRLKDSRKPNVEDESLISIFFFIFWRIHAQISARIPCILTEFSFFPQTTLYNLVMYLICAIMALGSTQPLTEMSIRKLPGG